MDQGSPDIGTMSFEDALRALEDVVRRLESGDVPLDDSITLYERGELLRKHVAANIGPIARPKTIIFTDELPKTRSGKIMRRLLKDVAEGRDLGDTTTLADPNVVDEIRKRADAADLCGEVVVGAAVHRLPLRALTSPIGRSNVHHSIF